MRSGHARETRVAADELGDPLEDPWTRPKVRELTRLRKGDELAFRVSRFGERRGHHWLIYNPGVMRIYHRYARVDARPVAQALAAEFPNAVRWADVGAGTGAYAAAARRIGRHAVGCELSLIGRLVGRAQGAPMRAFDLARAEPVRGGSLGPIDLAYCFEVAEHLDAALGDRLIAFLSSVAPIVVFTAAPPGQEGVGHINEQPKDYWIARFRSRGMEYEATRSRRLADSFSAHGVVAPWLMSNLMVYVRPD